MNWIAIIVAALCTWGIGSVWYHPKVLGTAWQKEVGMTTEEMEGGNLPLIFGLGFVFAIMIAVLLQNFVWHEGQPEFQTFKHGAFHGLLLCAFTVLPTLFTNALYERKSAKYMFINIGYWLLCFVLMGGILNVWR